MSFEQFHKRKTAFTGKRKDAGEFVTINIGLKHMFGGKLKTVYGK